MMSSRGGTKEDMCYVPSNGILCMVQKKFVINHIKMITFCLRNVNFRNAVKDSRFTPTSLNTLYPMCVKIM
jgi:hypothetical protein